MPRSPGERLGRATRFVTESGELWRVDDERLAGRLASLGASNVGGFVEAGVDDDGPWVRRKVATQTLDALPRGAVVPWKVALAIVRDLAIALDACERAGLF